MSAEETVLCAVGVDYLRNVPVLPKKHRSGREEQRMKVFIEVSTTRWKIQKDFMEVGLFTVGFKP